MALERDRMIVQAVPRSAEARNNLGGALLVRGAVDEAIEHLQEALRLDPDSRRSPFESRRGAGAPRPVRRGDRSLPGGAAARSRSDAGVLEPGERAAAAGADPRGDRAIRSRVSRSIPPIRRRARTWPARCVREGRIDEAIAELEQVLRVTPDFQPARRNLEIVRQQRRASEAGNRVSRIW